MAKRTSKKAETPARRRKGSGTVIVRNGRFFVRWREGGAVRQEKTGLDATEENRAEAEALLAKKTLFEKVLTRQERVALLEKQKAQIEAEIARLNGAVGPGLPLGDLVSAFTETPRRKDCSQAQLEIYQQQIGAFVAWTKGTGTKTMADVSEAVAEKYASHIGGKYSGSTYNKHVNALDLCWRALGRSAGVKVNPWADLPRKRKEAHRRRDLSQEEVDAVLATAKGELRDLVNIGLHTGMRLGDCACLQWESFKPDGTLEVRTAKTGQFVKVPSASLLAALARTGTKGDVLPDTADLYRRDPAAVAKQTTRLFEKAGLQTAVKEKGWSKARPDASFHSLRHTFASRLVNSGVPLAMVRELVGHSSEQMTAHYSHVSNDAVVAALKKAGL